MKNQKPAIIKPVLFCLLCAIALATSSRIVKDFSTEWSSHLLLIISIVITYGLTLLFTKWEKLQLKNVGVLAHKTTFKKVSVGFGENTNR